MHIVISFLVAAAPLAGEKIQREAEDRARAEEVDLLRTLCPEQCVLLSVRAQMDEEQIAGDPAPGVGGPGARTIPAGRAPNANMGVDQLPPRPSRARCAERSRSVWSSLVLIGTWSAWPSTVAGRPGSSRKGRAISAIAGCACARSAAEPESKSSASLNSIPRPSASSRVST